LVASLWWQYRQSDLTEELKEVAREIALTRTLPKDWSLGLRLTKWGNDKFWETPEQTKSIEIDLKRGDGNLIRIRSQYVASRLITSWNYRAESDLRSAIAKFNSQYTTSEPAITCDEVVAAISTLMGNSPSELARSHGLSEESIHTLRRVAMMHEMSDFTFERLQTYELADGDKFATWSVRLTSCKRDQDGKAQSFEIRKRFLKVDSARISPVVGQDVVQHDNPQAANLSQPQFDRKVQVPLAGDASLDWSVSPSLVVSMEEALQQVESQLEGTGTVAILMQQERLALSKVGPVIQYAIKVWITGNGNSPKKGDWIDINVCLHEFDPLDPNVVPLLRDVRVVGTNDDHPESTLNRSIAIELELTQIEIDRLRFNESRNSFTFSRSSISH
jgi:hypothetical protein